MSEIHLHLHIPPGYELHFDGEKLSCRPLEAISGGDAKIDFVWPVTPMENFVVPD